VKPSGTSRSRTGRLDRFPIGWFEAYIQVTPLRQEPTSVHASTPEDIKSQQSVRMQLEVSTRFVFRPIGSWKERYSVPSLLSDWFRFSVDYGTLYFVLPYSIDTPRCNNHQYNDRGNGCDIRTSIGAAAGPETPWSTFRVQTSSHSSRMP
jgi:hypothetical protein